MVYCFSSLRHNTIISSNYNNNNISNHCTTCTHCSKCFMTWCIKESNLLTFY